MSITDLVVTELKTEVDRLDEVMDLLAFNTDWQTWELIQEMKKLTWTIGWKYGHETPRIN
jgi:hypothetical protein